MARQQAVRTRRSANVDAATAAIARFQLAAGSMYRIAYSVGTTGTRRLSRSIGLFHGTSQRRLWSGEVASCLEFSLPHGRSLSLVVTQLVDARLASRNDRGQWVLAVGDEASARPRPGRRAG